MNEEIDYSQDDITDLKDNKYQLEFESERDKKNSFLCIWDISSFNVYNFFYIYILLYFSYKNSIY